MSHNPIMLPLRGDSSTKMSYVDHWNQFNKLERFEIFSPNATKLYQKILNYFNERMWKQSTIAFADSYMCNATGIKSVNTLKAAMQELESRGLIGHESAGAGRNSKRTYWLLQVSFGEDGLPLEKPSLNLSKSDVFTDSFRGKKAGNSSVNLSVNTSKFDTNYKTEDLEDDVTERGPKSLSEKKIGAQISVFEIPSEGSAAWAPQTEGGAAAVPAPAESETLATRQIVFDQSLPDDEFGRYEAVPRDAEMVDEYLRRINHPKAGRGELFYNAYSICGWVYGKHRHPVMNWKSLIPGFKFLEPSGPAAGQASGSRPAPVSQVDKRQSAVEDARAFLSGND